MSHTCQRGHCSHNAGSWGSSSSRAGIRHTVDHTCWAGICTGRSGRRRSCPGNQFRCSHMVCSLRARSRRFQVHSGRSCGPPRWSCTGTGHPECCTRCCENPVGRTYNLELLGKRRNRCCRGTFCRLLGGYPLFEQRRMPAHIGNVRIPPSCTRLPAFRGRTGWRLCRA